MDQVEIIPCIIMLLTAFLYFFVLAQLVSSNEFIPQEIDLSATIDISESFWLKENPNPEFASLKGIRVKAGDEAYLQSFNVICHSFMQNNLHSESVAEAVFDEFIHCFHEGQEEFNEFVRITMDLLFKRHSQYFMRYLILKNELDALVAFVNLSGLKLEFLDEVSSLNLARVVESDSSKLAILFTVFRNLDKTIVKLVMGLELPLEQFERFFRDHQEEAVWLLKLLCTKLPDSYLSNTRVHQIAVTIYDILNEEKRSEIEMHLVLRGILPTNSEIKFATCPLPHVLVLGPFKNAVLEGKADKKLIADLLSEAIKVDYSLIDWIMANWDKSYFLSKEFSFIKRYEMLIAFVYFECWDFFGAMRVASHKDLAHATEFIYTRGTHGQMFVFIGRASEADRQSVLHNFWTEYKDETKFGVYAENLLSFVEKAPKMTLTCFGNSFITTRRIYRHYKILRKLNDLGVIFKFSAAEIQESLQDEDLFYTMRWNAHIFREAWLIDPELVFDLNCPKEHLDRLLMIFHAHLDEFFRKNLERQGLTLDEMPWNYPFQIMPLLKHWCHDCSDEAEALLENESRSLEQLLSNNAKLLKTLEMFDHDCRMIFKAFAILVNSINSPKQIK